MNISNNNIKQILRDLLVFYDLDVDLEGLVHNTVSVEEKHGQALAAEILKGWVFKRDMPLSKIRIFKRLNIQ